ncbi:MAG: PTS sugar transporter subunit IIA [Flavobacteriaceae bacterium]|nr:PTS sugar transporter subunit IIA [Flavobacteriaceae bacterium]|tara:strand:- start:12249 stop:12512 length:264 start_codon:yes stop_codon:yes gene_type:complete
MISLAINIKDEIGFHARTASLFAKKASKFESEIFIEFKGKKVNAKSTLSIMTLGVKSNDEIVLITNGNDEKEAHNALISYIENNFND